MFGGQIGEKKEDIFLKRRTTDSSTKLPCNNIVLYIKNISIKLHCLLQTVGLIMHINFECNETIMCRHKLCVFDNFIEFP